MPERSKPRLYHLTDSARSRWGAASRQKHQNLFLDPPPCSWFKETSKNQMEAVSDTVTVFSVLWLCEDLLL